MAMEFPSHVSISFSSPSVANTNLRIRPLFLTGSRNLSSSSSSSSSSRSVLWYKVSPAIRLSSRITATADYSKRRPRRSSASKAKGPKGFMPRAPVGTSIEKKEKPDNVEKDDPDPGLSKNLRPASSSKTELKVATGNEQSDSASSSVITDLKMKSPLVDDVLEKTGNKSDATVLEDGDVSLSGGRKIDEESSTVETSTDVAKLNIELVPKFEALQKVEVGERSIMVMNDKREENVTGVTKKLFSLDESGKTEEDDSALEGDGEKLSKGDDIPASAMGGSGVGEMEEKFIAKSNDETNTPKVDEDPAMEVVGEKQSISEELEVLDEQNIRIESSTQKVDINITEKDSLEGQFSDALSFDERNASEESEVLQVEESLAEQEDPSAHLSLLENLAKENIVLGNKLFVYPEVLKPDQEVEVFLNRSISTLKNERSILIMGAFNDWRWRSFTEKLEKTTFTGDWWSCKIYVPKEAYMMDFVFFNGSDVYDNNDSKDYVLPVEGGMDAVAFEDFLLEEKRRELERQAAEEADRERRAEEQRRMEAEKAAKEADRAQAKVEVEKRRQNMQRMMEKAVKSVENLWYITPHYFKPEDLVRVYYNRQHSPLAHSSEVWIHGGYNGWKNGRSFVGKLTKTDKEDDDWMYAHVIVPRQALVLDWVFADGAPESARVYDNNKSQDFHAIVPQSMLQESYWADEEKELFEKLQDERRQREETLRAKAEKTARMKAETKQRTMKAFLLSQKHIVYTEPLEVKAGTTVTVFYNPSNTVLNGKPEVWFRCSFNRWTHRNGALLPQKMIPAENGSHLKATVKVPLDAYMMDFVFSEEEDGGIFDNKNGTDYHIPVVGGIAKEPPMQIVHIAIEMAPIAKVGGLGDVVTSLSRAVQELGHNVDIILPKYDCLNASHVKDLHFLRSYSWGGTEIKVWHGKVEGLTVHFLEPQNGLFQVGCIYGRSNDGERFGFFCHAALEYLLQSGSHPDIIHCHDWSSAPVAWLYKDHYQHYGLTNARVVFTIHNLEYGAQLIGKAMAYTDKATTVSPNYSKEVSGHPAIAPHLHKFHGILNGIDPDIWDPFNDKFIPVPYTSENATEGKRAAKEALQQKLGLQRTDHPLVGIITRLTHQKGIHLITHAINRILERKGQVALLGTAPDPRIQNDFVNLSSQLHSSHHGRIRLCLTYDEPLSHLIYAGADFIIVPSVFEPCGLTQLTAMRYGSIPVVRKTGGLYDTVFDVDHDKERAQSFGIEPNGFSFDGADAAGVDYALNRAISAWYNGREWFNSLCKRVMEQDWSWNRPALDYMELYYSARK